MRRASLILALAVAAGCAPAASPREEGRELDHLDRVVDGDTVELRSLGTARLIGVDTPEVHGGAECFGAEASAYTKRRLPTGTRVRYELGAEPRDRYQRALIYLYSDGAMLNEELVAGGYATPLPIRPNTRYEGRFERRAASAADARRGLWGACPRP